jgi:hypothetical protein
MSSTRRARAAGLALAAFSIITAGAGQGDPFTKHEPPPIVGRWDLTVRGSEDSYPSWLEVRQSGYRTMVGSFVGRVGSARPISRVDFVDGRVHFTVPPQWERRHDDQHFAGRLEGGVLGGETSDDEGRPVRWEARPAPSLARTGAPRWGAPVDLFNGHDLGGWRPRDPKAKNGWLVRDGMLVNAEPGNDLLTERKFVDFRLTAEFRFPSGSNSGIYLRGRYEVQIEDNQGEEPDSHKIGGVYGFLTPSVNAGKEAGQWQTLDVTLVGRSVTVILNGERVIDRQPVPGITGGALDSDEGQPGPILLQGDHGPVEFKRMTLTPAD